MLEALTLPPRLVRQALDDLHTLAEGLRRLSERGGSFEELLEAVRSLPRVEDELSANIAALRADLRDRIEPLMREVVDLDETAEALEGALKGFHAEIQDLRDRIPGI